MKANAILDLSNKISDSSVNTLYELTVLAGIGNKEGKTITEILGGTSASSDDMRKKHQRFNRVSRRLTEATQKPGKTSCPAMVKYGKAIGLGNSGPESRTLSLTARGKKELQSFKLPKNPKAIIELSDKLDDSKLNTLYELACLIQIGKKSGKSISEITGFISGKDEEQNKKYQRFKAATSRMAKEAKLVKIKTSKTWDGNGRQGNTLELTATGKKELSKLKV